MPLQLTSFKKILILLIFGFGLSLPVKVFAADPLIAEITTDYATKGSEYRIGEEFTLGLRPNLFSAPARLTITVGSALPLALPTRYAQAGSAYAFTINSAQAEVLAKSYLWLRVLSVPQPGTATILLGFNFEKNYWEIVGRTIDAQNFIKGATKRLNTVIVPVTDLYTQPGYFGPDVQAGMNAFVQTLNADFQGVLKYENLNILIAKNSIVNEANLVIIPGVQPPAPIPSRYNTRTSFYQIALRQADGQKIRPAKPIVVSPVLAPNGFFAQKVLIYNATHKIWEESIKNRVPNPESYFIIVEDIGEEQGVASWYRSKKYPDGAAHNRYPMGTKLKVTNLENGKTTTVKVVSRGPYVRGRVIDMVYTAFSKIRGKNGGVAKVKVAVVNPKVLGDMIAKPIVNAPSAILADSKAPVVLPISSTAAAVFDIDKQTLVATKNSDERHPIASLSKLMTALVYLDRKPTFRNTVKYEKADGAICSCLYVSPGETLTTNDLWHAMLIGSANNATRALVRSTKLSEADFVKLMNEKAKTLGLNSLTFADPTGLDPANQGSAADTAKLAAIAFARPEISNVTVKKSYTFSTLNTKRSHTITNRNEILKSGWQITGTKTGYIEESGFCLIAQVKGKTTGRNLVVVTLGSSSKPQHYKDMEKAFEIGFANL
ncbi:hypothetical protein C4546_01950 [Candidatus Parcubacteria bacterium]|jgi:D-alanyl-D-alanine carboxypeptidase|nr:MAG: hypothetical protein C4546_01950 [Candidatus Parcubacteria bacterium]